MGKHSFKVSLIISLAIHLCIILVAGNLCFKPTRHHTLSIEITPFFLKETFPKPKGSKRLAELNLPNIRPLGFTKDYKQRKSLLPKEEDTIFLNTRNLKYLSYSSRIKRKIESMWEYPSEARREENQGRLTLMFSILRSGNLAELRLLQPSGFRVLDKGAMNAVRHAAPYCPIPHKMGIDKLNIIATFEYRLNYSP